jgi:hypothetical protein
MTYDEAMKVIHRTEKPTVSRPGMPVGWRFGRPVLLGSGNTFIDYTPTEADMRATDWSIS